MDASTTNSTSQYLSFRLEQELFAVDIGRVREVLEFNSLTKVPGTPSFMRGVINLRGSVVPVVDIRVKLGLGLTEKTVETCVVISEIVVDGERTVLGVLVDSLQEVIDLDSQHLVPPPRLGTRINSGVVRGMGKRDERFIMILDLDRIFTVEDLRISEQTATAEAESGLADSASPVSV
jgi:purine-binding chemotaxis protein CheW